MHVDGHVGGYPIKFLEQIVRLSKCLKKKRELIGSLRDLNAQGEKRKSFRDDFNQDFQRRYASNVLELSEVNRDLNGHLKSIQEFTQEVCTMYAIMHYMILEYEIYLTSDLHTVASETESCPAIYGRILKSRSTEKLEVIGPKAICI